MPRGIEEIVVTGDVAVDWLGWRVKPGTADLPGDQPRPNWSRYAGIRFRALRGGAWLLADLVAQAVGMPVIAPTPDPVLPDLSHLSPKNILHSYAWVDRYPAGVRQSAASDRQVFRIQEFWGYCGPEAGNESLKLLEPEHGVPLVILDDAGNHFRYTQSSWPISLKREPLIILKMGQPLQKGPLWQYLLHSHADRLVVILDADDLRAEEVHLSRCLSWERTALDFLWNLHNNPRLASLKQCAHLVVRFALDGAIRYHQQTGRLWLYYDPTRLERGFAEEIPGHMQGLGNAFVTGFVRQVVDLSRAKDLTALESLEQVAGLAVKEGLRCARQFLLTGFGSGPTPEGYPRDFFPSASQALEIAEYHLSLPPERFSPPRQESWSLLNSISAAQEEFLAARYVVEGRGFTLVPMARFGQLRTVDRREIESLQAIKNLIREYLQQEHQARPLALAVFGPPGAGKSFAITQVAESVAPGRLHALEFNLSQWESLQDLIVALHQVRDWSLRGRIPLVFFDEFDCRFRNEELGWLKYFLSPIQDGKFKDNGITFHLSKAIFVFAGGTSATMEEFSRKPLFERWEQGAAAPLPAEDKAALTQFRQAKGPDFVSRLRGYVNIPGINPNPDHEADRRYLIRRAILLRSLLERLAPHLFEPGSRRLRIDWGVLQALLKVPVYKHGVRSLVAVLEMSRLSPVHHSHKFELAALPPREQLKLHVSEDKFWELALAEVPYELQIERLAKAVHEHFVQEFGPGKPAMDPSLKPWEELAETYKESNRGQARHIPVKLAAIGCAYRPKTGTASLTPTMEEIEIMARLEHQRWLVEKWEAGYVYGPRKDDTLKLHPSLLAWEALPPGEQEKDIQAVKLIPELLDQAGFELYRK